MALDVSARRPTVLGDHGLMRVLACLVLLHLLPAVGLAGAAGAPETTRNSGIRVVDQPFEGGVQLAVENSNLAAVTLTVTVTGANAIPDHAMPMVVSCPGKGTFPFVRLKPANDQESFSWRVRYDWRHGQTDVEHEPGFVYELPYPKEKRFLVRQGFRGSFTHSGNDAFAVDFEMPEGTPVLAARAGTVEWVVDRFSGGGLDPRFRDQANLILIRHSDGTYGEYVHLRKGGSRVKVGQKVTAGDAIGWSGNVGFTRGPHLHFAVFRTTSGTDRETFPMKFRSVERADPSEPVEGEWYTAP